MQDLTTHKNGHKKLDPAIYGKVPPQATELEEAILGAIMLEKQAFDIVTGRGFKLQHHYGDDNGYHPIGKCF